MKYHYRDIENTLFESDSLEGLTFKAKDSYKKQAQFASKMRDVPTAITIYNKAGKPVSVVTMRVTRLA